MNWPPELSEQAVRMRSERKTFAEIAEALDCSLANVYAHLMSLNGRKPKRKKPRVAATKPKLTRRHCMHCAKLFPSAGPHNRLCVKCRQLDLSPFAI